MALENLDNQSMEVIKNIDNEKSFFQDILIDRSLIEKENFDISEKKLILKIKIILLQKYLGKIIFSMEL